ncbi:MAG TPA: four helix bundle protein [Terriglobales bacterium]
MDHENGRVAESDKELRIKNYSSFRSLPRAPEAQIIGKQLLRSGTSVAANYRAMGRARSKAEFTAKLGIVVEEADETVFWLELLLESNIVANERLADLLKEAGELTALFAASQRTARSNC